MCWACKSNGPRCTFMSLASQMFDLWPVSWILPHDFLSGGLCESLPCRQCFSFSSCFFFPVWEPIVFFFFPFFVFWLWHGLFCILISVLHLVWNKSLNVQKWSWDCANKDSRLFLLFCLCECWKSVTPCLGSGLCYSESLSSCRTLARDAHFFLDTSCSAWIDFVFSL